MGVWWAARLRFSISLENFDPRGQSRTFSIFGPLGEFGTPGTRTPKKFKKSLKCQEESENQLFLLTFRTFLDFVGLFHSPGSGATELPSKDFFVTFGISGFWALQMVGERSQSVSLSVSYSTSFLPRQRSVDVSATNHKCCQWVCKRLSVIQRSFTNLSSNAVWQIITLCSLLHCVRAFAVF